MTTKTILIADDDADLVNILVTRCRLLGLNVLCAHDAFDALSLARSERPDMICLDVEMPAGNGLSVCEMLCFDESCRTIPIAILTGQTACSQECASMPAVVDANVRRKTMASDECAGRQ